jgi:hypothetical protein
MATLIFVHGTGVRRLSFEQTLSVVRENAKDVAPRLEVEGCFWGAKYGSRLAAGGASIPGYLKTRGKGIAPGGSPKDEEIALWALLYYDPLYELRQLVDAGKPVAVLQFDEPAWTNLEEKLEDFKPSNQLRLLLQKVRLFRFWNRAFREVTRSTECRQALATISSTEAEHRTVIARAVVARATVEARKGGLPAPGGSDRDALVVRIVDEFGGGERMVGKWLKDKAKTLALKYLSSRAEETRGRFSDASFAMAGDILLYQTRGESIRQCIATTIENARKPIFLLAHSLGGIACVDLLVMNHLPSVKRLFTIGSQAPFLYEINSLVSLHFGSKLPVHFPDWVNFYDPGDFLSYCGKSVFKGRVTDFEVRSNQPFPESHSAYWNNPAFWAGLGTFLK